MSEAVPFVGHTRRQAGLGARTPGSGQYVVPVRLNLTMVESGRWDLAARARGVTRSGLLTLLVEVALRDDMVHAILDDDR